MLQRLRRFWPLGLVVLIGMVLAWRLVEPPPPKHVTIAAGGVGGAFAKRYAAEMEHAGVTLEVLATAGSVENRDLLQAGDVDFAIVQGGIMEPADAEAFISLGGIFEEPLWVFARSPEPMEDFADLKNMRMAIGPEGSGTRKLMLQLRQEWGDDWPAESALPTGGQAAADALIAGDIDAAAFVASIGAGYVNQLMMAPDIELLAFPRAPAISRRHPSFAPATLLRGVVDIETDIPALDVPLIAPVAQIIAPDDLHPAIQALLLDISRKMHSGPTLMAEAGTFPDGDRVDIPLSSEAQRYFERGPSTLRRWFPFGVANFLERTWVMLIPLLTLAIPLIRAAPPIYRWRVRRRIYVWYSDLRDLERRGRAAKNDAEKGKIADALTKLQRDTGKVEVPLSYTDDLYRLRNHITFVQELLHKMWRGQLV